MRTQERVVVIGGGAAGLACAVDLAAKGVQVTLLERAASVGGKIRTVEAGGVAIDAGPTVFTMRWVFEELFAAAGTTLTNRLNLRRAEVLARHAWPAGTVSGAERRVSEGPERFDLFADVARSVDAVGALSGAAEARRFKEFCARARAIYETLERTYIAAPRPSPLGLVARVGPARLGTLLGLSPLATMWSALGAHFEDPRLRQLFGRYATYCGSSPFAAPATLMLVAHVEQAGVWLVEGGMRRLALAMADLARELGAEIRCDAEVAEIETSAGRVSGVRLADGTRFEADAVVAAGDVNAVASGLFGGPAARAAPRTARAARSLSAIVWSAHAETSGFPLERHNVFFSRAYQREFDELFRDRRAPAEPTVYVCAQDRGEGAGPAPVGPERLHILINAPAEGDRGGAAAYPTPEEIERCRTATWDLMARCGLETAPTPQGVTTTTPRDFAALFPATGGALYGRATHGALAAFQRPAGRTRLPGLYLASGSAHPGPGAPMAALSGRIAAASALADFASERPRRRAATTGGMSTA